MSKVTAVNAGSSSTHRSEDAAGEQTSKRRPSSRVQKERGIRKSSPDNSRGRGQSKRKKKRSNAKKDDPANDKSASMEDGENEDPLVIYENEDNEDEEHTDSDDSTTDSDTDTDSEDEPPTVQNTNQDDIDEDEEDEDEVMDDDFYARRRRSLLGYNASFNYTRLAIEKLTDHPIVLRACDSETMWDSKELATLQEDLRLLYKKARQRIKTMKRDVKKLDTELQRKRDLSIKRPKPNEANDDDKNKDIKQHVCGVMNSRGNPCQRTGFCPFHHKLTSSRGLTKPYDFFKRREETNFEQTEPTATVMVASGPKERQEKMQVSILLVAAAALERKGIDESDVAMKDDVQQAQPVTQRPMDQFHQTQNHLHDVQSQQPHGFHQISSSPFFSKPFNSMPQLPSLHDLSERPPPPFQFDIRNEPQDTFMHSGGIARNTTAM